MHLTPSLFFFSCFLFPFCPVGPYLVVNFWLVLYTWLQHTDVDVPHLDDPHWNPVRGAFLTVDRPYGPVLDFLHHRIGSTHVAHHLCHQIPHYHAKEATEAIKVCQERQTQANIRGCRR